jgi:hypothetical protein
VTHLLIFEHFPFTCMFFVRRNIQHTFRHVCCVAYGMTGIDRLPLTQCRDSKADTMGTHILNDAADPSVKACEVLVAHGSVDIVSEVVEALADNLVHLYAGEMGWGGWRGGRGVWGVGAGAKEAETHCHCSLSCSAYMASTSTSVTHYCVAQRSLPCTQGCIEHTAWGRGEFIWVLGRLQAGWPPGKRQRQQGRGGCNPRMQTAGQTGAQACQVQLLSH